MEAKEDNKVFVLNWPSMDGIAHTLTTKYSDYFTLGKVTWEYFPDGWPNIHFEHLSHLQGRHVVFLGSLQDRTKFVEQLSMVMVLPRQFVDSLNIVFPYFAPATMERVDEEGVIATAETVAKLLASSIPMTRNGPASLRIFDIHANTVRFYFPDNVMMKMMRASPLVIACFKEEEKDGHKIVIAFPDDGAAKRFKPSFPNFPVIVCSKVREGDNRIVRITDRLGFPEGLTLDQAHVVVVDDLVQSGGTLDECRKALLQLGAKRVSASVTHAVFPNDGWKHFLPGGSREGFHRFFVTNTIPEVANQLEGKDPFVVLRVDDLLAEDIIRTLKLRK